MRLATNELPRRLVAGYAIAALTIMPACARSTHYLRLQPERETVLHVGQTAAVDFDVQAPYAIGSAGGSLIRIKQVTSRSGGTTYVYRAVHVGPDTLVATPKDLPDGHCISCVTRHYFITVVP